MEFNRGGFFYSNYTRTYELIQEPFEIANGVTIAPGPYSFQDLRMLYLIQPQSRVNGEVNALTGTFYGGTRSEVGYKGRVEVTSRFAIEPRLTLDWIDLPVAAPARFRRRAVDVQSFATPQFAATERSGGAWPWVHGENVHRAIEYGAQARLGCGRASGRVR